MTQLNETCTSAICPDCGEQVPLVLTLTRTSDGAKIGFNEAAFFAEMKRHVLGSPDRHPSYVALSPSRRRGLLLMFRTLHAGGYAGSFC